MEVINKVVPNAEQMKGFLESGNDKPIYIVELAQIQRQSGIRRWPNTSELSGAEDYGIYAQEVVGHLAKVGGAPMFSAQVERLMLGEVEELWDTTAIAMYPSRKAMLEMISSPDYQASAVHREAGLAGQLNIELVSPTGEWFAQ